MSDKSCPRCQASDVEVAGVAAGYDDEDELEQLRGAYRSKCGEVSRANNLKGQQWYPLFTSRLADYISRQDEFKDAVLCLVKLNGELEVFQTMESDKKAIKIVKGSLNLLTAPEGE